jgi:hypothetical protein
MQPTSKQRISKRASTTIGLLLGTVFLIRSAPRSYLEGNWGDPVTCQFKVSL